MDGVYFFKARFYDSSIGRFLSADSIIPPNQGVQGYDRFAFVSNNPVNFNDPTGHAQACIDHECDNSRGSTIEEMIFSGFPDFSLGLENKDPFPINDPLYYSDTWGLCVYGNCSGVNLDTYNQFVDSSLDFADSTLLPIFDGLQGYTGIKIPENGKIGFGLDALVQLSKDRDRADLNSIQRLLRAGIVAGQGVGIGNLSLTAATGVSTLMIGPGTTAAVRTGNLHLATAIIGGSWIGTYAAVNIGSSWVSNEMNSRLFPVFGLGSFN